MLMLAIMIGDGVPMKDHDKWRQVALTNGWRSHDGFEQRYNKARWDARGPGAPLQPAKFSRHLTDRTGCNNPVGGFSRFLDFSRFRTTYSGKSDRAKRTDCSRMESFQHPRP
jgi:hypothetical protein